MDTTSLNGPSKPKLLDRVRTAIRLRHYSPRTEEAYAGWVRPFVVFHLKRHPAEMGEDEVRQFLIYLAEKLKVSAATQNQALNALVFLYRNVLELPFGTLEPFVRAKRAPRLVALLIYGSGLRLLECLTLRVKDLDFEKMEIRVRRGKGGKDRVTMLPSTSKPDLLAHLQNAKRTHEKDLLQGAGRTALPDALAW